MKHPAYRLLALVALVATASALGCRNDQAILVSPNTPSAQPGASTAPSPSPSRAPSASSDPTATTTASTLPSASPEAVGFREDFNGPALDPARWLSFPQSGILRFQDGKLDMLNTNGQKNFPYFVTKDIVVPTTGPFFAEFSYQIVTFGSTITFALDYLPAETPGEAPLTTPFMSTSWFYQDLKLNFVAEDGTKSFTGPKGIVSGAFHRVRVENDNQNHYRVIFDATEVGSFTSKRRPQKFWVGQNPPKDTATATNWPRIQLDYVEIGPLASPDPATPVPASPSP